MLSLRRLEEPAQAAAPFPGVYGRIQEDETLHTLRMLERGQHRHRAAGRVAHQDGPLHPKLVQQPDRQIYLGLERVRIVCFPISRCPPVFAQRAFRQPEGGSVEGDDAGTLGQVRHDLAPRKLAGAEAVEQQDVAFAAAQLLVVDA